MGVSRGSGGAVLVEAPAGLGKSALLDDTVAGASGAGLMVLRAGGHQLERAFSWGVARTLFEGLLRGMPQGLDGVLDGPVAPARAVLLGGPWGGGGAGSGEAVFGILHALYWLVVRLGERRSSGGRGRVAGAILGAGRAPYLRWRADPPAAVIHDAVEETIFTGDTWSYLWCELGLHGAEDEARDPAARAAQRPDRPRRHGQRLVGSWIRSLVCGHRSRPSRGR
jgi:hypothetical protein